MDATHNPSPTGDRTMDRLLPLAGRLVQAAHHDSTLGVHSALADAEDIVGDPLQAALALVVLLAAMCDDDTDPADLVGWRSNPVEYRRLRSLGVPADEARVLAQRVAGFIAAKGA